MGGAVLPEFQIKSTLEAGITVLKENLDLIDDLFEAYGPEAVTMIRTYIKEHTPRVVFNWPRPDYALPVFAVVTQSESEDKSLVGDVDEPEYMDEDAGEDSSVEERMAINLRASVSVMIFSQDANLTLYLYHMARLIFLTAKMDLHTKGVVDLIVNGADFQMDPEYFPDFTYSRVLNLNFLHTFSAKDSSGVSINRFRLLLTVNRSTVAIEG